MSRFEPFPIHVTVPGSPADPRAHHAPEGVKVHYVPHLHPDDVVVLPNGLRITSVAGTLVDLADEMTHDELRATFERARQLGLLDMTAVHASRARVEWRPSLELLDAVMAEFSD